MERQTKLGVLQKIIAYKFNDLSLLEMALTAPSYRGRNQDTVRYDNQRLEFLGDAVYGLLAAEYAYINHPALDEGKLTLHVTHMANGRSLTELARSFDLGAYVLSAASGAVDQRNCENRTLEDALEALFGALWCDGGYDAARALFRKLIEALPEMAEEQWHGNPKGALQELAQQHNWPDSPCYILLEAEGPDHDPSYTMQASVHGGYQAQATAGTKRAAEAAAATALILKLKAAGFEL